MTVLERFDTVCTKLIGTLPKSLHTYFDGLGYMAMPVVWFLAIAVFIIFKAASGGDITQAVMVLAAVPVATILKLFIRRKRPMTIYADAMKVKSYSFPSSHAYSAAVAGGYFAFSASTSGLFAIGILLLLVVMVIGVSRVHLGAHYPSDVVAGWLLGIGLLIAILRF